MICVVLTSPTIDKLLAEHRRLVVDGVELVEWRLDFLVEPFEIGSLLAARPGPVIVTLRLPPDGGHWQGDESRRRRLLVEAMQAGAEYVDLEESTAAALPRVGTSRRIVSMHDFRETPADLTACRERLASHDADIVKLATMANSTHDAFRMLDLVGHSRVKTVGLCMGELGLPTRLLAERWSAPFTYAAPDDGPLPAPGQLRWREMRDLYRSEAIGADTAVYGVIGDPIQHSLSPQIHNAAFRHYGLNAVYIPFRVPPDDLQTFLDDAPELGLRGLSVTIPHKEGVLAKLTEQDEAVRAIGAANTLIFDGAEVRGYNTDEPAAIESLAIATGQPVGQEPTFAGRLALVLGAGGAAKAIAYGLKCRGANVVISSRTVERAEELAAPLGCRVVAWDMRHDVAADILVNCTPLGMSPNVDATPYDAAALRSSTVVFDTVYNPETTRLLANARHAGCATVSGVEMFVRQAARQFKLFTGREAPLDLMREVVRKNLR